jgi:capsular polysaccharide biosynthesis protein
MRQALPLRIIDEVEVLPALDRAAFERATLGPDVAARHDIGDETDDNPGAFQLGGEVLERWPFPRHPPLARPVSLCLTRDVIHLPAFGVVMFEDGTVLRASAREAMEYRRDLSCLPGARVEDAVTRLPIPPSTVVLERAAIFQAWGGNFNYGHFILDCLPSLMALDEHGLLDRFPPIAPRLKTWQRDLVRLTIGAPVRELKTDFVRVGTAVHATSMDHFLHGPGALLERTRARILARSPSPKRSGRRLYFSRRGHSMRVMINEAALESALRARGFEIIKPERSSVAEQIEMMQEAQIVVGPTGAAMANALFARPGARIVEIQPENFTSQWVWATARRAGAEWCGYVCASPVPPERVAWRHRIRRGFRFGYQLPLDDFLIFVDALLK